MQELAQIVIKHTVDKKEEERRKVTGLLVHCFKKLLITEHQVLVSFTKVRLFSFFFCFGLFPTASAPAPDSALPFCVAAVQPIG